MVHGVLGAGGRDPASHPGAKAHQEQGHAYSQVAQVQLSAQRQQEQERVLSAIVEGIDGAKGSGSGAGQARWQPASLRAAAKVTALRLYSALVELRFRCCKSRRVAAGEGMPEAPQASVYELRSSLRLVLEAQGYQLFFCEYFNGDPHPGNFIAIPDGRVGLIDLGQCCRFDRATKARLAKVICLLAGPQSEEADTRVAELIQGCGVRLEKGDKAYLAFMCRLCLTSLKAEWFKGGHASRIMSRDNIADQPAEIFMITRAAKLLRGFGMALAENISIAEVWCPLAERWLKENPDMADV